MTLDPFDYDLPPHLIAQHPVADRDSSRLMVLNRTTAAIAHHLFRDLPDLLDPGDLLVLNDSRVLPARLYGQRESTGGRWEGLFLRQNADGLWEMLAQTGGKPTIGETIAIAPEFRLILRERLASSWLVEPQPPGDPAELLAKYGHLPLPPYIRKGREEPADRERYQTIYAKRNGSVAAPTAGLHFTPALFDRLRKRGIHQTSVTLHVGLGTFEPIRTEDPTQHPMHDETAEVPESTVEAIQACKARGNRVVAIGTTASRAIESAAQHGLQPFCGETNLYIYPPYRFKVVDALVTNFHLPKTTLLYLVSALAGMELLKKAYTIAIQEQYRFFSYGDAMVVL